MTSPTRKQAAALRMIAQSSGLLVTQRSAGDPVFTFRDGTGGIPATLARQLIDRDWLVPVDRGLFGGLAQSYRAKT